MYERLPDQQLQGFDDEVVKLLIFYYYLFRKKKKKLKYFTQKLIFIRIEFIDLFLLFFLKVRDSAPPFRVLEKCQDLCLRDRTAGNNLPRACASFDFQPGSRIASFSGTPEYEESTCYLTREQAQPEGIGNLMLVPNSVHFTEVCLTCE